MNNYEFDITKRHAVKYEKQSSFNDSIFSDVYDKAFKITQKIIDINNDPDFINENRFSRKNIYNIIPFIGGRGSGKTSAMLSYASFLDEYSSYAGRDKIKYKMFTKKKHGSNDRENLLKGECSFSVLDFIDASLLESGEDILEIIIANLFLSFKKVDERVQGEHSYRNSLRRELYQKFENFYFNRKKINSRNNDKNINSATSIEQLNSLAISFNLREELTDIIEQYLKFTYEDDLYGSFDSRYRFLVIPIDDIDMNIDNCYYMLEQIRRYLMIPNVIILMSADYNQMIDICITQYRNKFEFNNCVSEDDNEEYWKCNSLAIEYLSKLIPDDVRVNMPYIMTENHIYRTPLYVNIDVAKNMYNISVSGENGSDIHIHDLILYNIVCALHLYLPKRKYSGYIFEPNTIRTINSLLMGMKQLRYLGKYSDRWEYADLKLYLDNLSYNYKWLVDDLQNRVIKNIYNVSYASQLNEIIKLPLEKKFVWDQGVGGNENAITYDKLVGRNDSADILNNDQIAAEETQMLFFSYTLTYIMENIQILSKCREKMSQTENEKIEEELTKWTRFRSKIIRNSTIDNQCNELINKVNLGGKKGELKVGYKEDISVLEINTNWNFENILSEVEFYIVARLMITVNTYNKSENRNKRLKNSNFSAIAFLINIEDDTIDIIESEINEILAENGLVITDENEETTDESKKITDKIEKIINEYKEWKDKHPGVYPIPLNNLFFIRDLRDHLALSSNSIVNSYFEAYELFYRKISERLKEKDGEYSDLKSYKDNKDIKFVEIYESCPYIKKFFDNDEKFKNNFNKFCNSIFAKQNKIRKNNTSKHNSNSRNNTTNHDANKKIGNPDSTPKGEGSLSKIIKQP